MSQKNDASLSIAEESRDTRRHEGILAELSRGVLNLDHVLPFPGRTEKRPGASSASFARLKTLLKDHVAPDEIDATGEIPDKVIDALRDMTAFGIKIPEKFGGLGLSQSAYANMAQLLGSWDANVTALISASNSIGLPEPLKQFGTNEQQQHFLPRIADGAITAFGLTEPQAGSDLSRVKTLAVRLRDDSGTVTGYRLTGEKLWTTNATKSDGAFLARYIVIIARIVDDPSDDTEDAPFGAFIVDTKLPGMRIRQRCHFMGLRALYSGHIRLFDVTIPVLYRLGNEGDGIRIALSSLAIGRLTLPAACIGGIKQVLAATRQWTGRRVQWFNRRIADHELITQKLVDMAAHAFALEAIVSLTCRWVDAGHDVRLESAACKLLGSEWLWQAVDEGLQARGGRGFERPSSLKERGDDPIPFDRWMRDARINRIFEGTNEMMLLWIAREALEPYKSMSEAGGIEAIKRASFLLNSLPGRNVRGKKHLVAPELRHHLTFAAREARRLRTAILEAGARFGGKLMLKQCALAEISKAVSELFAIVATCSYATTLNDDQHPFVLDLADYFSWQARLRIEPQSLRGRINADPNAKRRVALGQHIADNAMLWLEDGILAF